jgi:hypothetical protein
MTMSIGSVVDFVWTRFASIDTTVSGNLVRLASGALMDIGQATGQTISATDIPDKWFNVAVNLTSLYARAAMDGGAVTIGTDGINISKGMSPQAELWAEQVTQALKRKPIIYQKVFG